MSLPTDLTEREELTLMRVLSILRGGFDRVDISSEDDVQPAVVAGKPYPAGHRVMGTTFTIRAVCDHVRDPLPNEILG